MVFSVITPLNEYTTHFPAIIKELIPTGITEGSVESKSISNNIQKDWFVASEVNKSELRPVTWLSSLFVTIVTK